MVESLRRDTLKALGRGLKVCELKGIRLSQEDCHRLISICNMLQRAGDVGSWRNEITSTAVADVLVKYKIW